MYRLAFRDYAMLLEKATKLQGPGGTQLVDEFQYQTSVVLMQRFRSFFMAVSPPD